MKQIFILYGLLLMSHSTWSQIFQGGSGQGYTNTELLIISDGLYAYQGDTSDGYDTATYEPYSPAEAIFVGGQDDGYTQDVYLPVVAGRFAFFGGQGTGYSFEKSNCLTISLIVQSVQDGSWQTPTTWDCSCVPDPTQSVLVRHTVSVGANVSIASGVDLSLNSAGLLQVDPQSLMMVEGGLQNAGIIEGPLELAGATRTLQVGQVENVRFNSTGTLTMGSDTRIQSYAGLIGGTVVTNNFDFVLNSDANRTALIDDQGGLLTGDITQERHIRDNFVAFRFFSSAVDNAAIGQLSGYASLSSVYYYDETDPTDNKDIGWLNPPNTSYLMAKMQGFIAYINPLVSKVVKFTGPASTGPFTRTINYTQGNSVGSPTSTSPQGWELVGNPYPSPIDWHAVNIGPDLESSYYVWIQNQYASYSSANGGISVPATALTRYIPSSQGFWVRSTAQTTLSLDNSVRVTDPDLASPFYKVNAASVQPLLRLEISSKQEGYTCESVITFNDLATDRFDKDYDAWLLPANTHPKMEIAALDTMGALSISIRQTPQQNNIPIPLHHLVTFTDSFYISAVEINHFPTGATIYLEDRDHQIFHDLSMSDYAYSSDSLDNHDRFVLHLSMGLVSGLNDLSTNSRSIYTDADRIHIQDDRLLTETTELIICDVLGRELYSQTLQAGQASLSIQKPDLPSSNVYVVSLKNWGESVKVKW
jgi:hypothetical protein